jgi:hypothetical protein
MQISGGREFKGIFAGFFEGNQNPPTLPQKSTH